MLYLQSEAAGGNPAVLSLLSASGWRDKEAGRRCRARKFSKTDNFLFSKMKKVFYSIRKVRNSDDKISGLGFLNDEGTLFCKCVSKNGKRYTRAFDDVDKHCFPVFGKENEFKGYVTMYYEYEGRDIEVEYSVWYKTV